MQFDMVAATSVLSNQKLLSGILENLLKGHDSIIIHHPFFCPLKHRKGLQGLDGGHQYQDFEGVSEILQSKNLIVTPDLERKYIQVGELYEDSYGSMDFLYGSFDEIMKHRTSPEVMTLVEGDVRLENIEGVQSNVYGVNRETHQLKIPREGLELLSLSLAKEFPLLTENRSFYAYANALEQSGEDSPNVILYDSRDHSIYS